MQRIAETFANGVCSELRLAGATISPAEYGVPRQDRTRLKRVESWRRRAGWALAGLLIPASAATYLASKDVGLMLAVWCWTAFLLSVGQLMHWRVLGMRARFVAGSLYYSFGFLLILTAVIILGALHVIG